MKKSKLIGVSIFLFTFFFTGSLYAQKQTVLHIVTSKTNHLQAFKTFHFTVNGLSYELKPGECMDLTLQTDSVNVIVNDRRWVKNSTDELHFIATESEVNILVQVRWKGNYRDVHFGAVIPCKECYDDLKSKCR